MNSNDIDVVILAAGKGTRMKSDLPKVLTPVAGKPIIVRLIEAVRSLSTTPILVVGHKAEEVIAKTKDFARFVVQKEQRGTGHAVSEVLNDLKGSLTSSLIVMPGDHPMVSATTFEKIAATHKQTKAKVTLATLTVPHFEGFYSVFNGYGRILRDSKGSVASIREYKDATEEEKAIREVNPGYYCFDTEWLSNAIAQLKDENVAHELYLTDMVEIARTKGETVTTVPLSDYAEAMGINTPEQKLFIEESFFKNPEKEMSR